METENYIRTPISFEHLIKLNQDIFDDYDLYVEKDTQRISESTIVYLDELIGVNEETEEEIYPDFATSLDLQWYLSGQVVWDIFLNTRYQLLNPTIEDYIKNVNYYDDHDCFFDFSRS